jgi:NADH-quinone oxidoreductase subunit M
MILIWLLIVTAGGGAVAWLAGGWSRTACRWVTLVALGVDAVLVILIWAAAGAQAGDRPWLLQFDHAWITPFGIRFHLGVDGLSLLLVTLTVFLGLAAVLASWTEIQEHVGAFHATLLATLAGTMGVFMALDLFLFYFFWELMLVPMYFLIGIWGHENRVRAALKFFLFTQAGGLLILVAILALYLAQGHATGTYSFAYEHLLGAGVPGAGGWWLMLAFFAGFAVKLPVVPLHTWLPDAHTEAPTAGSVILAGLMLKTGAYGFLRFALPLFPAPSAQIATAAMILGVIGILYGAMVAFAQSDAKRLVAYTSVSHLGFALLGIYAGNPLAQQGAVVVLLAHGLSTGGLFIVVGILQERFHTRQIDDLGGLWSSLPRLGGFAMVLALASLGLPGLANFIGEFLVLTGTFAVNRPVAIVAAAGFVLSSIYSLWLIYRLFQGPEQEPVSRPDLGAREMVVFGALIVALVWMGLYPQPVLTAARPALARVEDTSEAGFRGPQGVSWQTPYDPALVGRPPAVQLGEGLELLGTHADLAVASRASGQPVPRPDASAIPPEDNTASWAYPHMSDRGFQVILPGVTSLRTVSWVADQSVANPSTDAARMLPLTISREEDKTSRMPAEPETGRDDSPKGVPWRVNGSGGEAHDRH